MKYQGCVNVFMQKIPTFKQERLLFDQGYEMIVGVDEAGCGALAGPVCAGAVILPLTSRLGGLKDSKLLSATQRNELYDQIVDRATAWAVGWASVEEIEQCNIRGASFLAMQRAVEQIPQAQILLVDAWRIPGVRLPQKNIIHGDRLIKSIAAASVLAKVSRDRLMMDYHERYPLYRFDLHKGYGTEKHRRVIEEYGPCEIHRLGYRTFNR